MNYAEILANRIAKVNPEISISGEAEELLDLAWEIMIDEVGVKVAQSYFRNPDFAGDLIDAYQEAASWFTDAEADKMAEYYFENI